MLSRFFHAKKRYCYCWSTSSLNCYARLKAECIHFILFNNILDKRFLFYRFVNHLSIFTLLQWSVPRHGEKDKSWWRWSWVVVPNSQARADRQQLMDMAEQVGPWGLLSPLFHVPIHFCLILLRECFTTSSQFAGQVTTLFYLISVCLSHF